MKPRFARFITGVHHSLVRIKAVWFRLPWQRIGIVAGVLVAIANIGYAVTFFWPRTVSFLYATESCTVNPVIFPGLVNPEPSDRFEARLTPTLSIGSVAIYSHTTCITARQTPQANSGEQVRLSPFIFGGLLKKTLTVTTGAAPQVRSAANIDAPVSAKAPLVFNLDQADQVFSYRLKGNSRIAPCTKQDKQLSCDLPALELAQATGYRVQLERLFNNQSAGSVLEATITTVTPIGVVSSSIAWGEVVHSAPTSLTLTLNKPAASYEELSLTTNGQPVPITHSHNGNVITVQFTQPLARSTQFTLALQSIVATDKGYNDTPFSLTFNTSGGPKVLGINIGSYKVSTNASIVITFDSNLAGGQNLGYFIRAERDTGQIEATYTVRGNTVTITPRSSIARCTAFSVKVYDGLKNDAGISGGSGYWQHNSRTICQSSFSIGSSVQGRSIIAYRFGTGESRMVFVGGIHGDERSSVYTMNSLMDYLEANIGSIPAHRSIIIIPVANPDGYAANSRFNARGVDLNRNFPVSNWKAGVTGPDGVYREYGGGTAPLSEPESTALASFTVGQNPRLVMSYHAYASIVAANESGDSYPLAQTYGRQVGYGVYGNDGASNFDYDTTGAFEDWLHETYDIAGILVELTTKTGNEFSSHRSAITALLQR